MFLLHWTSPKRTITLMEKKKTKLLPCQCRHGTCEVPLKLRCRELCVISFLGFRVLHVCDVCCVKHFFFWLDIYHQKWTKEEEETRAVVRSTTEKYSYVNEIIDLKARSLSRYNKFAKHSCDVCMRLSDDKTHRLRGKKNCVFIDVLLFVSYIDKVGYWFVLSSENTKKRQNRIYIFSRVRVKCLYKNDSCDNRRIYNFFFFQAECQTHVPIYIHITLFFYHCLLYLSCIVSQWTFVYA